jgi:5'-nucleotidase
MAFTGGAPLAPYLGAFNVTLFLSQDEKDVQNALKAGFPAAVLYQLPENPLEELDEIRIAFDGDAVLFSADSERIFQEQGLEAFQAHEHANADKPLADGPFAKLLRALAILQQSSEGKLPIRTALVTARGGPSHERVIKTLRAWGVDINEAFFLGGVPKGGVLKAFKPQMFFDDHAEHCEDAAQYVPTGRVPSDVRKAGG